MDEDLPAILDYEIAWGDFEDMGMLLKMTFRNLDGEGHDVILTLEDAKAYRDHLSEAIEKADGILGN